MRPALIRMLAVMLFATVAGCIFAAGVVMLQAGLDSVNRHFEQLDSIVNP